MNPNASPSELMYRNKRHLNKFMNNPLVLGTVVVMAISLLLMFLSFIMVSGVKNPESVYHNVKFRNTPYMTFVMISSPLTQIAVIASFLSLYLESKKPDSAKQNFPMSTAVLILSVAICIVDTLIAFSYKSMLNPSVDGGVSALLNAFSKDTKVEDAFLKLPFFSTTDMFKNIGMISLFRTLAFTVFAVSVIASQLTPYFVSYGSIIYGIFSFIMIFPAFFFFILSLYPSYYPSINPAEPLPPNNFVPLKPDYIFVLQRLFTYVGYLLQTILGLKLFSYTLSAGWLGRKIKVEEEKN